MIKGFSKLSKEAKIEWLITNHFKGDESVRRVLETYLHPDEKRQKLHDEFIENTLTNFYLPFGVAPNFLINGKDYCVPMAIEESSVVAAAAKSANFWYDKGGFKAGDVIVQIGDVSLKDFKDANYPDFSSYEQNLSIKNIFFIQLLVDFGGKTKPVCKKLQAALEFHSDYHYVVNLVDISFPLFKLLVEQKALLVHLLTT